MELELLRRRLEKADSEESIIIALELVELKRATNERIDELMEEWGAIYCLLESYKQERESINLILQRIWKK